MKLWALFRQLAAFGMVGLTGLIVDVALFNLLRSTVLDKESFAGAVLVAKFVSTVAAIAVNWVGNRYWSFAAERTMAPGREMLRFFVISIGAMLVPLTCLFISHVLLGLTSALADNIASNVVGLVLGAAVRFALYRRWVFTGVTPPQTLDAPQPAVAAESSP
ncbi:GtrA family protein [Leucobacter sp. M11]|uniref:GtrA family protein n=1 Tax=Leucobacter sp. M11 TaxID=2993565 RepID=UPI002D7F5F1A|nr:GtrA family protein [Leucobacter sp. M11]MEB4613708.1 GtrA family protein [Leucobacter sp. M11]